MSNNSKHVFFNHHINRYRSRTQQVHCHENKTAYSKHYKLSSMARQQHIWEWVGWQIHGRWVTGISGRFLVGSLGNRWITRCGRKFNWSYRPMKNFKPVEHFHWTILSGRNWSGVGATNAIWEDRSLAGRHKSAFRSGPRQSPGSMGLLPDS